MLKYKKLGTYLNFSNSSTFYIRINAQVECWTKSGFRNADFFRFYKFVAPVPATKTNNKSASMRTGALQGNTEVFAFVWKAQVEHVEDHVQNAQLEN